MIPRGSGDHQPIGPRARSRIGKRPRPVRDEERARLEVGAHAGDLDVPAGVTGRRQLPATRRRLDRHRGTLPQRHSAGGQITHLPRPVPCSARSTPLA